MATDQTGSFATHANYLRAIACEAGFYFGQSNANALAILTSRVLALPSISDVKPVGIDLAQVRRSLENAWGTELLLAMSGELLADDELFRIANNWAVVQCYYVAYHAVQALGGAKGQARVESHSKTQNQFRSFWVDRTLSLSPWTLGVGAQGLVVNEPSDGVQIDPDVHSWVACTASNQRSLVAKAYRTTRDDEVKGAVARAREAKRKENRKAWNDEEEERIAGGRKARKPKEFALPRLSAAEKVTLDKRVKPSGYIQYLYRLRIKANYVDSTMFTDGPEDDWSARFVHSDLCRLAASTMLVHELHVAQLVGKRAFRQWADSWLKNKGVVGGKPVGLAARRQLL